MVDGRGVTTYGENVDVQSASECLILTSSDRAVAKIASDRTLILVLISFLLDCHDFKAKATWKEA